MSMGHSAHDIVDRRRVVGVRGRKQIAARKIGGDQYIVSADNGPESEEGETGR
jgi:hypothetical protein